MPVRIGGSPRNFVGHEVTDKEWQLIEEITRDFCKLPLTELAGTVCELLEWRRPNGGLKSTECYLFLQNLRERGMLPWLPEPKPMIKRPAREIAPDHATDPQPPLNGPLSQYAPVIFERIEDADARLLFRQFIHRYHYLGHKQACGAQLRYFIRSRHDPNQLLACLLFTSAAWKMAPRDEYIGWNADVRPQNLPRIINQSRFLIMPWVKIPHLASHILGLSIQQLRVDWEKFYGVRPVLMETLVDRDQYPGTCYRAANWVSVGITTGRGRMDRFNQTQNSRKEIFLYPMVRSWQKQLREPPRERAVAVAAAASVDAAPTGIRLVPEPSSRVLRAPLRQC
ncbi:MAG TPA: Druantia anti-phage system protein DruA [Bryobacteraceae bacterium]|nr:Druantia anti-phage system protein DruA [Bryobacteraceae bacterium]